VSAIREKNSLVSVPATALFGSVQNLLEIQSRLLVLLLVLFGLLQVKPVIALALPDQKSREFVV
jgi:hypothetical protein